MGIDLTTPPSSIDQFLNDQINRRLNVIWNTFNYIGIACVDEARENGSYTDRTGNLRNSIGYVVVKDGVIVSEGGFQGTGGEKSKTLAYKLATSTKGIVLIVVAGMNYASHVEAIGKNVLTSAELLAEQLVPKIMSELGIK